MKVIAVIMVVLALVIGIVPRFTDCQSQGKAIVLANGKQVPMKCHWTGQGEIALAVPLVALGAVMAFSRRKESKRALSVMGIVLGVFVIALPTSLIGVCSMPDMLCNSLMKPALIFSGGLVAVAGAVGLVLAGREGEPEG